MKFAHLADCHVGGWREPKMREANNQAFLAAIKLCLKERVDFVLVAGDLFNTAVPAIDSLKLVVEKLKELKDAQIPVYAIAGSHDFSASGKTMLEVLESAGLIKNVESEPGKLNFTIDQKTGALITGLSGRKGGLEHQSFAQLPKAMPGSGFKVFMFHTTIAELKPKELMQVEAMPVTMLPEGFDYYAGGHVHIVSNETIGSKRVVYPGPTFPNNFAELEKLKAGSFVIVRDGIAEFVKIQPFPVQSIVVDAEGKSPAEVEALLKREVEKINPKDAIVTIRVSGCLSAGKPSDINFQEIVAELYNSGAWFVMKNTGALTTKELEEVSISSSSVEELESGLVEQHASQKPFRGSEKDVELTKRLMRVLAAEKAEGERVADFEKRLFEEIDEVVK